jgi:hypothetical protein
MRFAGDAVSVAGNAFHNVEEVLMKGKISNNKDRRTNEF